MNSYIDKHIFTDTFFPLPCKSFSSKSFTSGKKLLCQRIFNVTQKSERFCSFLYRSVSRPAEVFWWMSIPDPVQSVSELYLCYRQTFSVADRTTQEQKKGGCRNI